MKTLKWKSRIIAILATTIAFAGIPGVAFGQTNTSSAGSGNIKQEKKCINRDLAAISMQQERIKSLEKQCRDEHATALKPNATRTELLRARADLEREKAYLKADKEGLMWQHQACIAQKQAAVRQERKDLRLANLKLNDDLDKGIPDAAEQARIVVNDKRELIARQSALNYAIVKRNDDLLAINKQIESTHAQPIVLLSFEDERADIENEAIK